MPSVEQLTDPITYHGEGPVWSPAWNRWGSLALVDMLAGDVCFLGGQGGPEQHPDVVHRWHLGKIAACVRPTTAGGLVAATERHFVIADEPFGNLEVLDEVFDDPGLRFNEGACDPAGNFLAGSMSYSGDQGEAALYRLTSDHRVEQVLGHVSTSNGLCWNASGELAYYVDSPTHQVDVFDSGPSGELRGRRRFVAVDEGDAVPDGLTVDADGGVWVALFRGGAVLHFDADGRLQQRFDVPARQVTACTFGGPGLDRLYITTSRENLPAGEAGPAGALFVAEPGVRGLLTRPYTVK